MQRHTAQAGIDYYFRKYTQFYDRLDEDKKRLLLDTLPPSLSWYGGEPFLNFDLIQQSASYFKSLPWEQHSIPAARLRLCSNTNLSIMNGKIIRFLRENRVHLYASLDGPQEEHDRCRVFERGKGTFQLAYRNLVALKNADAEYFRTYVTILGVYTEQHDCGKCLHFLSGLGASSYDHSPAEYVGAFAPDVETAHARFIDLATERFAAFQEMAAAESKLADPQIERFASLFPFVMLKFDDPQASNSLNRLLTCPMGFDNLMLSANGDYLICHKVDDSMTIGRCESGLDFKALVQIYYRYNTSINNPECKNCWIVNFCDICAATRMADGSFVNPSKHECDYFRARIAHQFSCFSYLATNYPALWDKICAYRRDKRKYIGVVDINDF